MMLNEHSLQNIQSDFADDVMRYEGVPKGCYVRKGHGSFSSSQLIQIYRNNYYSSLTEALKASYGCIARLVGEAFFSQLAHDFIDQYGLKTGDLTDYGSEFASFLEKYDALKAYPYLVDVAQIERLYERAYHAQEHEALNLSLIAQILNSGCSDVRLVLHESVGLMVSDYPIYDIWQLDEQSQAIDLGQGGQSVLIFRQALNVQALNLSHDDQLMFSALQANKTLNEVLEDVPFSSTFNLQSFILNYVQKQVLIKVIGL